MSSFMIRRAIAAVVTFFLGWATFQIVRPVEHLPEVGLPEAEIVAIRLESLGCTDAELKCPIFDVTFRSVGNSSYVGDANSYLTGRFEGSISEQDFESLVDELYDQGFFQMAEHYTPEPVLEPITVEVITNDGSQRVSSYSWESTPRELRALQALIQYQLYYVEWNEVK